ncbi:TadE/TadG family type IV pilus assembly protein [Novipirellula artificiosorum]|uniref:TadE-like protein n=1 Tax=Novipirellula artificiosorum TaxID=2528016 RepID=A0A5C6DTR4_9BACT|nr:TadE/TadG family type IV pilus assembly protein [Novipirellula artificiosorum]TWU40733.1 TadE-like protein [Novipirellula artificiosorum]
MVEFAIIANVLFMIILTCMEFARMNMARNLAQDAAYFAARVAMVPGATSADAVTEVDRIMGSLLNEGGYSATVSDVNFDAETISVTVSVDLKKIALFAPMFLPETLMETTAVMRTERYEGFYEQ